MAAPNITMTLSTDELSAIKRALLHFQKTFPGSFNISLGMQDALSKVLEESNRLPPRMR